MAQQWVLNNYIIMGVGWVSTFEDTSWYWYGFSFKKEY
jgi:hypothetical protein